MGRVVGRSLSGLCASREREPLRLRQWDVFFKACIGNLHQRSRGTRGVARVHTDIAEDGVDFGRKRVARVMGEMGLEGISRRRGTRTTCRDDTALPAPDIVVCRFCRSASNSHVVSLSFSDTARRVSLNQFACSVETCSSTRSASEISLSGSGCPLYGPAAERNRNRSCFRRSAVARYVTQSVEYWFMCWTPSPIAISAPANEVAHFA